MDENLKNQLEKKIRVQRRTIIILSIYLVLSLIVQLYNMLA